MPRPEPSPPAFARPVTSLKAFYALMDHTCVVRRRICAAYLQGEPAEEVELAELDAALTTLLAIPTRGPRRVLELSPDRQVEADLGYEIGELEKDLLFLRQGEERFMAYLAELHSGFADEVACGVEFLGETVFRSLVTDRDGTTNNYCGRYRSSIQSVYNAVFLARFAGSGARTPIMMTSAPLTGGGILDINVTPPGTLVLAASKGREFVDKQGVRHHFPIEPAKQARLDALNERLTALLTQQRYEAFGLIGSGLQFKFGQTTVARQDISSSIPAGESEAFLETVRTLVHEADPEAKTFRIEDTGLDIEIILTISQATGGESGRLKDFDKGDGVAWIDEALGLDMARGPHLVCGDTPSDLPMVRAARTFTPDTWAIFVTRKDDLAQQVRETCEHSLIVTEPDVLVAILGGPTSAAARRN